MSRGRDEGGGREKTKSTSEIMSAQFLLLHGQNNYYSPRFNEAESQQNRELETPINAEIMKNVIEVEKK
jgi:hypothetical protein